MLRRNLFEAVAMAINDEKGAHKDSQKKKRSYKIEVSDAHICELRRDFDAIDLARAGPVQVKELEVAMKRLDLEPNQEELIKMVANQDPSGAFHFNDFLRVVTQETKKENTKEELKKVFQMFDYDGTGNISLINLLRVSKELGQKIAIEELKEMIDEADRDGDSQISWEEFYQLMKRPVLHPAS